MSSHYSWQERIEQHKPKNPKSKLMDIIGKKKECSLVMSIPLIKIIIQLFSYHYPKTYVV